MFVIGLVLIIGFFVYIVNIWKFNLTEQEVNGLITEIKNSEELPQRFYELYNAEYDDSLDKNLYRTQLPYLVGLNGIRSTSLWTSKHYLIFSKKYYKNRLLTANSLALKLENNTTQKECLNWVVNQTEFGYNTEGIKSAANYFFDKELSELNDRELATLVIMLKNSSLYNPKRRKELVDAKVDKLLEKITMANKA